MAAKKKVTVRRPSRFQKGMVTTVYYEKLEAHISEIRELKACDYLMIEQACELYAMWRETILDVKTIVAKNEIRREAGEEPIVNRFMGDFKTLGSALNTVLKDLGLSIKDRDLALRKNEDELELKDLLG